ncbi:hypothetical protein D7X30_16985 [Corallococcus sp. AB011P]|uniref:SIR2 family protein n=1 Tax=Corallococcus sp. AB011P TaxID=2316735 RepID=UPI000EA1880A|nr:SIR2 family protein [Corallococcus sp. AB011P]RKG58166.1 hypothetical protein D7X30_16985 [Corallococcus sp. AB011P]
MTEPQILSLDEAAFEIHQACLASIENGESPPFFFITGAGISHPPIPLARQIIEHCKDKAKGHPALASPQSQSPLNEYSYWFSLAYPHPQQRTQYFEKLISNEYISAANLRLAHLLLNEDPAKRLTNLVFTLNFDNFLSRALTTFGKHHVVCDHPQTTARINLNDWRTTQVVHVHGSYNFYDCRNLASEIANAAVLSPTSQSMPSLLDAALRNRAPLVVGYSGWEGDIVMSALKRRLDGQTLPFNLYWFCFSPSNIDTLPAWLKHHENIRFVINKNSQATPSAQPLSEGVAGTITPVSTTLAPGAAPKNQLPAHMVFERLSQAFSFPAPGISLDPLEFIARQMEKNLPKETNLPDGEDLYQFRAVVSEIRAARAVLLERPKGQAAQLLEEMREAIRTSQFEAIALLAEKAPAEMSTQQRLEALSLLCAAVEGLEDNPSAQLSICNAILKINAPSDTPLDDGVSIAHSFALASKAQLHHGRAEFKEALAAEDDCISQFGASAVPKVKKHVAQAIILRGFTLQGVDRAEDSLQAFETVLSTEFEIESEIWPEFTLYIAIGYAETSAQLQRPDKAIQLLNAALSHPLDLVSAEFVIQALNAKAVLLRMMGRHQEAEKIIIQLLKETADTSKSELAFWHTITRYSRATHLRETGSLDAALPMLQDLRLELQGSEIFNLRVVYFQTLISLCLIYAQTNQHELAIATSDTILLQIPADQAHRYRSFQATAMFLRGVSLQLLGRNEEAVTSLEAMFTHHGTARDSRDWDRIARAYFCLGDCQMRLQNGDAAREAYQAGVSYIETHFPEAPPDLAAIRDKARSLLNLISR